MVEWYDKLSSRYTELYGREQAIKVKQAMGLVGDEGFEVAVDVACGTGFLLEELSERCKYVVGLDLSRKMLEAARAVAGNAELVRADCSALPFREKIANCCFAISLIEANSKGRSQLSELARITRPDGYLVVTVFHPDGGGRGELDELGLGSVRHRANLSSRESLILV